jgi:membrane-associated phospholipid phosphatase
MVIAALALMSSLAAEPPAVEATLSQSSIVDATPQSPQSPDQDPPQPAPAGSDVPAEEKKPPTPPHTGIKALVSGVVGDARHLPSKENALIALGGAGLALAAHQVDPTFNQHLNSHYTLVNGAYAPAKYFGGTPIQTALALGTYATGRLVDAPKVSHLGMDLLRAQILTEGIVEAIKVASHRERPDGSNHQSFPSGHAAITFASATVLERHLGWKRSAVAYAVATYVATSRLHDNVHYLSDVAFGAAVGTIVGRTITQHGRNVWTFMPSPVPGGMAIYAVRIADRE